MNEFNEIIGNKKIVEFLKKTILQNKVSHAYVFDGIEGIGKSLFANAFAKSLQCTGNSIPCNICNSCKSFDSGNNPDVIYIKPKKNTLSVDDIRDQINKTIDIKPYVNKYKIYILDSADKMNISAQNALLKTVEEPPQYAVLILLSNNSNLFLKTIMSRVVKLKLSRIDTKQISDYLRGHGIDEKTSEISALYSMGSVGHALKISTDEEFIEMRQKMLEIATSIINKDLVELFFLHKEFEPFKEEIIKCLDILYMWYRDILMLKEVSPENVLQKNDIELLERESKNYSCENLFNILDAIEKSKEYLSKNSNYQLTIEMLMIKIKENTQLPS